MEMTNSDIHTFDNGVSVYKRHLLPVQVDRYATINVHEAEEEDIFIDLIGKIPDRGIYVNIGSAIGYYVLLARKLRPDIRIIAIEPLKLHLEYFLENIQLNGFQADQFKIIDCAISSENGEVGFIANNYGSMICDNSRCPGEAYQVVSSRTLDSIASEINKRIDVCQMDVQGAELNVLNGAVKTIASGGVASFLIGTHGQSVHNGCVEILRRNGYQIIIDNCFTTLQPDGIICATI